MVFDFEQIYKEHFTDVYKYVLSISRDEAVAEEITQESFFKAMQNIDKFDGGCKLYVWLCQIAKNTYFSLHKKRKRHTSSEEAEIASDVDIENDYLDKETSRRLHVLLHNLGEPYK